MNNQTAQVSGETLEFMGGIHVLSESNNLLGVVLTNSLGKHLGFDKALITVNDGNGERTMEFSIKTLKNELQELFATVEFTAFDGIWWLAIADNNNWIGIHDDKIYFGENANDITNRVILMGDKNKLVEKLNHFSIKH